MAGRDLALMRLVFAAAACLVLVSPSASARVNGAPSLCRRLAVRLGRSPGSAVKDAQALDQWLRPWVRFAHTHPVTADALSRQVMRLWRTEAGSARAAHVQRLRGSGLMRISGAGAELYEPCSQAMYLRRSRGGASRVLAVPILNPAPCRRFGQRRALATVLGQPAYVESDRLDFTNSDALLRIVPWLGRDWGRVCPLAIRFSDQATLTHRPYCHADRAVCAAAGGVAPALGRRYRFYVISSVTAVTARRAAPDIQFGNSLTGRQWRLIGRGQRLAAARALAPANGAPPWLPDQLSLRAVEYFPLQLNGRSYLGAVGPGPHANALLFGVFRVPRARSRWLHPLAVFRMRWQPVSVQSVQVSDRRAAAPLE